jgi:hypothetical protein
VKALKMAVVFGECGRECLSGPGNTEYLPAVPVRQQAGLLAVPARPAGGAAAESSGHRQYTLYS